MRQDTRHRSRRRRYAGAAMEATGPERAKPTIRVGRSRTFAWVAVALWIAVILSLGGDGFSGSETSRYLGPLLHWLFPDAGPELLTSFQYAIRKSAHFFEYAMLALLCVRAWRLSTRWSPLANACASLVLVLAVAAFDESRQSFTQHRTGAASDVALDTFGGAAALLGARIGARWLSR